MINLLPAEAKRELSAGRANRLLLRYLMLFLVLAVVMLAILLGARLILDNTKKEAEAKKESIAREARDLAPAQAKVSEFKADLATAKKIFDKQINYSWVILRLAEIVPSGTVVSQVTFDPSSLGSPTKLNVEARSIASLTQFKDNLNESKYFEVASFDVVTRQPTTTSPYKFTSVISVTIKQELLSEGQTPAVKPGESNG